MFRKAVAALAILAAFCFSVAASAYEPATNALYVYDEPLCTEITTNPPIMENCIIKAQVNLTAPVPAKTFSFGDAFGNILLTVASAFGVAIATALTNYAIRLAKKAGLENADLLRDQLDKIILNGINQGASAAAQGAAGKASVDIKSATVASAIDYAQTQGAVIIKQLGEDPNSEKVITALKARIESAIVDPSVPTNPVLDPTVAKQAA